MVDIENLNQYQIEPPDWNIFDTVKDSERLSTTHKDQIIFLDEEASNFLYNYLKVAKLVANNDNPFSRGNFKIVEEYTDMADQGKLKKWLYNKSIPFKNEVFLLGNDCILTTWKIVVKYAPELFFSDDIVVFDKTLNWCLFYFHHDHLFFGHGNIYDNSNDFIKMEELNRLKKLYPQMKFPY